MSDRITITVRRENWERLRRLGTVPETFNDILTRLLDQAEERKGIKQ
jgi:hypothetical protein